MDSKRNDNATYNPLSTHLEELLSVAQPRLVRLAQKQGVTPDGLDDVVQETLVEAWRHLEHLRNPDRFDAWLNGICRNVSLRWNRTHIQTGNRQINFSSLTTEKDEPDSDELGIPDPLVPDPAEELQQQFYFLAGVVALPLLRNANTDVEQTETSVEIRQKNA